MNPVKTQSLASVAANQYWQLLRAMLFNFKIIGFLFVVFIGIALVSFLCALIFPSIDVLSKIFMLLSIFILMFVGVIALPMGMITLCRNKHISAMTDIRHKLFIIVFAFCVLQPLIIIYPGFIIKDEVPLPNLFFFAFMFCALYFWLATYLGSKKFEFSFIAPLIMTAFLNLVFKVLIVLHPILLALMSVVFWGAFYRWWLSCTPNLQRAESIYLVKDPAAPQRFLLESSLYFPFSRVRTAMGSLLLGYGDGFLSIAVRILSVYVVTLIFSLFVCSGVDHQGLTDDAFMAILIAFAYSFLFMAIDLNAKRKLRNIKRAWLVFSGDRLSLFHYLEVGFLRGLGFAVLLNFILVLALLWFSHKTEYFFYCIGALAGLSVSVIMIFYSDIYFYKCIGSFPGNITGRQAAANIICLVPLLIYLVIKFHAFNIFEMKDAVAISLLLLPIAVCLRNVRARALKRWQAADL